MKRNVFFDMIDDFTGDDDDDDDGSEEEDEEEKDDDEANVSESVESTTTRFGRFISPLAFSKISETLGSHCAFDFKNPAKHLERLQRKINFSSSPLDAH